ncbi:MAG: radical SAM protein [Sulfolobales archaeon]|nr:radical SAM protein [Sulfolobales archaeon]MDW8083160.1 radical SAM protein [Sulfolobales archaeon]
MSGYNPLDLAKSIEPRVHIEKNGVTYRKYFRFRVDRWYGGIVTGDVVGCNLRCKFCWAWYFTWESLSKGYFYSADEAALKLVELTRKSGYRRVRLSGGEPTLGFKHLLEVVNEVLARDLAFTLETNGLVFGYYREYSEAISKFRKRGIEIRVSVKGTNPHEFFELTGADPKFWYVQIDALRNLIEVGLEPIREVYPAVMLSMSGEEGLKKFISTLRSIHTELPELVDEEYIILYRHVKELMKRTGLKPKYVVLPDRVPSEMI